MTCQEPSRELSQSPGGCALAHPIASRFHAGQLSPSGSAQTRTMFSLSVIAAEGTDLRGDMLNAIMPVEAILLAAAKGLLDAVAVWRGVNDKSRWFAGRRFGARSRRPGFHRRASARTCSSDHALSGGSPEVAGKGRGRVADDQDGEKKRKHGWSVAG